MSSHVDSRLLSRAIADLLDAGKATRPNHAARPFSSRKGPLRSKAQRALVGTCSVSEVIIWHVRIRAKSTECVCRSAHGNIRESLVSCLETVMSAGLECLHSSQRTDRLRDCAMWAAVRTKEVREGSEWHRQWRTFQQCCRVS